MLRKKYLRIAVQWEQWFQMTAKPSELIYNRLYRNFA